MINAEDIIRRQLDAAEKTDIVLDDGSTVTLTPARLTTQLADDDMKLCLNGSWRVTRWPFDVDEAELAAPNRDDSSWQTIEQPGPVFYADPEESPATVEKWNRVTLEHVHPEDGAVIRRQVSIPEAWRGKRIFLRFDAVYPAARFYCNGSCLGEHLSGLTPAEWDVTDVVTPGEQALVAVRLLRKHEYVQMDMPRHAMEFTGISQDAYFHAAEQCRISDYHLITELDESYRNGSIHGEVSLCNDSDTPRRCVLTASLADGAGDEIAQCRRETELPPGGRQVVDVHLEAGDVALWNDEFPNLYDVGLALDASDQPRRTVSYRTGFRRFELKDQRPTLNGNPVKFRGVNHLTCHMQGGMHTPKNWLRDCLTLMKRANVNAVRTHFLGPPALAELCDDMGMYLLQELPIDWGTNYVQDKQGVGPVLMRLEGGVRRDRHHPSLMVWCVGNENMPVNEDVHDDFNNHLRIYDKFVKTLDPSRPTMFPPPGPANKIEGIFETQFGDIADTHYSFTLARQMNETGRITNPRTWDGAMETITREEALESGWSGVWFSSEYGITNLMSDLLNAPYISIIADTMEDPCSGKNTQQVFIDRLREEWGYMRGDPSCLGGAYFSWLCAGTGDPWGWTRFGEDADWGVVTADLLPKPAFWAMRVIFSPVQFPERLNWSDGQTEITFDVTNLYNSIDLERCTLRTMMGGGPPYMGNLREWQDVPIAGAPGEAVTIRIPIWNKGSLRTLENGSPIVCRCILLDPSGYRPVTADILVMPKENAESRAAMPIGPDAEL